MICSLDITVTPSEVEFRHNTLFIDDATNTIKINLPNNYIKKIVNDYLDGIDQEEGKEIALKLLKTLTNERQSEIFDVLWNEPKFLRRNSNG